MRQRDLGGGAAAAAAAAEPRGVNGAGAFTISPYLASMSTVYSWAKDELYDLTVNGSITR